MLEKVGKYEIRLQVGRGAMGTVYEGFDPVIGRRVAIKTLRTEMFESSQLLGVLTRFKREAQSAGRLSHPNIVTIHDYGEEDGTPYIVMEYISGTELGHHLTRGSRFTLEEIVRLMTQMLVALSHAHEHGVVHRDLKPANMFLLEDGSLKVVDFGIARIEASDLTDTGAMLGTPAYMSPEQCLGTQVDHRSDLFSAGVILYQLLTGDRPFTGSVTTIIQKVLRQEPLPPSELNPTLSPAWDRVVARAMAKKPESRYESARQFAEAVKSAFTAERVHEDEVRRKTAEAEEHAHRAAEERSRAEAARRLEDERREAERVAKTESQARRESDSRARRESEEATVLAAATARRRIPAFATAILLVLGVFGAILYTRLGTDDDVRRPDAARIAAETRAREEVEKRAKAEVLAREEAQRRSKLETDVAKKEAEATREVELAAKARAAEEAKAAAVDQAKALALKKDEENRRKTEAEAQKVAESKALALKKDEEDRRKTEAEAQRVAEAKARTESESRRRVEEQAKREAEEKAQSAAIRKAESTQRAQTTINLSFSSWVPPSHHLTIWQQTWATSVERATGGRIKFQSLAKAPAAPPGTFDAVKDGLVDMSYVTASYTPTRHTLSTIAELPGAGATAEITSVAFSRIHWRYFQKIGEYNGVKLLAVWTHGPGQMFNTKRPIESLADLKGMRIRTGGGIAERFGNLLGASTFIKPAPESYDLLQSGAADGLLFPLESIATFKLDRVIKYTTILPGGFYNSAFGFFMNLDKWNTLSKQDQAIVEQLAGETAARSSGRSWDASDAKALDGLRSNGIAVTTANPAFVNEAMSRAKQLEEAWIRSASAKGLDGARVLADFREEIKRVTAGK